MLRDFLQIIKKAAVEAVEASSPAKVMYGTVVASSPLAVRIEQRLTIPEAFLTLTKNVRDYKVRMSVNGGTEQEYTVKNGLKTGDRVMLLREQGGQNYIVLDKIGGEP